MPRRLPKKPSKRHLTTKLIGDKAETLVVAYLERLGYRILERNWRTRYCEIDIVAAKNTLLYFVEVKYRSSSAQGGGFTAVTPAKVSQMGFAARLYEARHLRHDIADALILMVASVDRLGSVTLVQLD
ncbi:MAG: YraN family protein [Candidatus Saccharimonadota bacterium]